MLYYSSEYLRGLREGFKLGLEIGFDEGFKRGYSWGYHDGSLELPYALIKRLAEIKTFEIQPIPKIDLELIGTKKKKNLLPVYEPAKIDLLYEPPKPICLEIPKVDFDHSSFSPRKKKEYTWEPQYFYQPKNSF